MELKYSYYYFISALDPETCKKIIELGESRLKQDQENGLDTNGFTFGETQKGGISVDNNMPQAELTKQQLKENGIDTKSTYIRDSHVSWLEDKWLYELIQPYVHRANNATGWNWQWDYSEPFQFTKYEPGQFYSWHKDGDSDHNGIFRRYIHGITQEPIKPDGRLPSRHTTNNNMVGKVRKLSVTINLNEPGAYEGGDLKFDWGMHVEGNRFYECTEIRPQGSIIVFPSFLNHCVTPVTSGTRYSLVLWNLGDPFK
jgi:hypothetical protein